MSDRKIGSVRAQIGRIISPGGRNFKGPFYTLGYVRERLKRGHGGSPERTGVRRRVEAVDRRRADLDDRIAAACLGLGHVLDVEILGHSVPMEDDCPHLLSSRADGIERCVHPQSTRERSTRSA